jgi:hypothetical protein
VDGLEPRQTSLLATTPGPPQTHQIRYQISRLVHERALRFFLGDGATAAPMRSPLFREHHEASTTRNFHIFDYVEVVDVENLRDQVNFKKK